MPTSYQLDRVNRDQLLTRIPNAGTVVLEYVYRKAYGLQTLGIEGDDTLSLVQSADSKTHRLLPAVDAGALKAALLQAEDTVIEFDGGVLVNGTRLTGAPVSSEPVQAADVPAVPAVDAIEYARDLLTRAHNARCERGVPAVKVAGAHHVQVIEQNTAFILTERTLTEFTRNPFTRKLEANKQTVHPANFQYAGFVRALSIRLSL